MMQEPRHRDEYSERQVTAAKRVLVDLGQVLGSYKDSMVVVGGWVPDLLLPAAEEQHIGSIDVDFLKAHALAKRDKPKDAYDICYCIEHYPGGMEELAKRWRAQSKNRHVARAIQMLRDKFDTVNSYGSQQVVVFHNAADPDTQAMHARRAFETVQKFIQMV